MGLMEDQSGTNLYITHFGYFGERAMNAVRSADKVFIEKHSVVPPNDLEKLTGKWEDIFNRFVENGEHPECMRSLFEGQGYFPSLMQFLRRSGEGRSLQVICERTSIDPEVEQSREEEKRNAETKFVTSPKYGRVNMETYLENWDNYLLGQEKSVARQIMNLGEPVSAILGSERSSVQKIIGESRKVSVVFPSQDYPTSFDHQMIDEFRRTGTISEEIHFRRMIEYMVLGVLTGSASYSYEKRSRFLPVANYFAGSLDQGGMDLLRGFSMYKNQSLLESGPAMNDVFENEGLPSLEAALEIDDLNKTLISTKPIQA